MASHRINLRGPWDFLWLRSTDISLVPISETGTVNMPKDWQSVFGLISGTSRFRRKFHRPTNLDPHEQVMIVFTEIRGAGTIRLNDQPVGSFTASERSVEFEITAFLKPFNELEVEIEFAAKQEPAEAGGLFGVVALEIRST